MRPYFKKNNEEQIQQTKINDDFDKLIPEENYEKGKFLYNKIYKKIITAEKEKIGPDEWVLSLSPEKKNIFCKR